MRAGIFGGTFNPPHLGHARALECFIEKAMLDKVYVIPTYLPPHKALPEKRAGFEDRLNMCSLAFSSLDKRCEIVFSDIEKRLFEKDGEKSYTWKTLELLKNDGEKNLCLYMGTDMFLTLDKWKRPDFILKTTEIWVMPREDSQEASLVDFKNTLVKKYPDSSINIIDSSPLSASSTDVRRGGFTLLSPEVREYIVSKGLYVD